MKEKYLGKRIITWDSLICRQRIILHLAVLIVPELCGKPSVKLGMHFVPYLVGGFVAYFCLFHIFDAFFLNGDPYCGERIPLWISMVMRSEKKRVINLPPKSWIILIVCCSIFFLIRLWHITCYSFQGCVHMYWVYWHLVAKGYGLGQMSIYIDAFLGIIVMPGQIL